MCNETTLHLAPVQQTTRSSSSSQDLVVMRNFATIAGENVFTSPRDHGAPVAKDSCDCLSDFRVAPRLRLRVLILGSNQLKATPSPSHFVPTKPPTFPF